MGYGSCTQGQLRINLSLHIRLGYLYNVSCPSFLFVFPKAFTQPEVLKSVHLPVTCVVKLTCFQLQTYKLEISPWGLCEMLVTLAHLGEGMFQFWEEAKTHKFWVTRPLFATSATGTGLLWPALSREVEIKCVSRLLAAAALHISLPGAEVWELCAGSCFQGLCLAAERFLPLPSNTPDFLWVQAVCAVSA